MTNPPAAKPTTQSTFQSGVNSMNKIEEIEPEPEMERGSTPAPPLNANAK